MIEHRRRRRTAAGYRKLLEDCKKSKAQEYKQIASILHDYRFKDPKIKSEAQKLLQTLRNYYKSLDDQIKALDSSSGGSGTTGNNSDKRRGKRGKKQH